MKKINKFSGLVLVVLIIALIGCKNASSPSSSDETPATDNAVKYIPVIGGDTLGSAAVKSARTISVDYTPSANDPQGIKGTVSEMAPILTGFKANLSNQYKIGDTFTSTVLGQSVITTISESNGSVIYTGIFPDGRSYYKLIIHSDMTFDFEQKLELSSVFTYEGSTYIKDGTTRIDYEIVSVSSVSAIAFNAVGEYDGIFMYKNISTRSTELTSWNYNFSKYEIRSNTNAWVLRHLECGDGSIDYTADGEFTLANPKITDIFANGGTIPTKSLAAGTLCTTFYCFNSTYNGFCDWNDDGSTQSFTFDDVKGVSQTMTYKDAAAYIWANMK